MGSGAPKINQQVRLEVPFGPFQGNYVTRVEGIDDLEIKLGMPIANWEYVTLPPGIEVTVEYQDEAAVYRFNSVVVAAKDQALPQLTLRPPDQIDRIQRRDHVRIDVDLSVRMAVLPEEAEEMPPEARWPAAPNLKARTRDLSAGGSLIVTEATLTPGSLLEVALDLPRGEAPLGILARVVRVVKSTPKDDHEEHWVALQWVGITENDRSRMTRFIFTEQVSRRRKGLV